ncbi:MAG: FkbM family methyltransferase [Bacteroidota bacterium]|nr:FkbM family methyltransferase [Bacteroidota bacterium]
MSQRKEYINSTISIKDELLSLFDPGAALTIFDIGACEGEDSIRYSNLFPQAHVYSFEPNPKNVALIKEHFKQYGKEKIRIIEEALSDKIGTTEFHISSGTPENEGKTKDWNFGNKSSSLLPPDKIQYTHKWLNFNEKIEIKTNTILNFCGQNNIKEIDFIHMDVQGAELKVLKGSGGFISKIKAIWLEVSSVPLYKDQALKKDIEKFMQSNDFSLLKSEISNGSGDQFYINNAFFGKKQSIQKQPGLFKKIFSLKNNPQNNFRKESFSQSGEDLIVKFIFDTIGIQMPTYIDIGAHHPFHINNTAIFYNTGSKGINVEPNPENFNLFPQYRERDINLNLGIAEKKGMMDYYRLNASTLNTFSKEEADKYVSEKGYRIIDSIRIETDTLGNILKNFNNGVFPDFLSLDVEGMDEQILETIDYEKNAPIVICTETISFSETGEGVKNTRITDFLISKGYIVYADTYINSIFVKSTKWKKK